ncbi:hypothetical protein ADU90_03105 [Clostridium botulinum]|uniref:NADP oxidoreductase n=1 Tax=Clostridium botulinum C/D str. DC5 TaxID=1443128 RepID=A0A0A0INJ3_CLOBO|nr:Rossmann-like and DUF2520 domain-containing protein [Clostridium botulinum]KEI05075.1 hypothetical protein Z952_05945 [Clostridium botulinum C/D str. BKT75002]KEI11919.1 hypothetical protein Z954_07130 [Clostridium botulinum C/D str. BKT2873]KGM93882.1 hypothetical protein Z956_09430 [Clostridium botulinum D str. CCUG 7971]KGN01707.1 hypothetical protein Z955_01075 [Clostridium botulinum C/D str. DC5]KOC48853.1 hypothetical protein ADU88_07605 [Clostridium botulinum]
MNIGFIGGGQVGFSLGKYFCENGLNVKGYYSRTYRSACDASKFTNSSAYKSLEELIKHSDTIFITIPDDSIHDIWNKICKNDIKGKIICHTSGLLSSSIFSNINSSGAFGYSIHPMFPFCDKYNDYKKLKKAYFSIEGNIKYLNYLYSVLSSLGNSVILIQQKNKALYHLANVTVSNLVLSIINLGCSYLEKCNISNEDCIKALFPLIESNVKNLKETGFLYSLTGPVERGDLGTLKTHMETISNDDKEIYKNLSLNLLKLCKIKNPEKNYRKLEEYLGG